MNLHFRTASPKKTTTKQQLKSGMFLDISDEQGSDMERISKRMENQGEVKKITYSSASYSPRADADSKKIQKEG
jgi:hypothetical protein